METDLHERLTDAPPVPVWRPRAVAPTWRSSVYTPFPAARTVVGRFIASTAVYVLSRQWKDLLSQHVLRMQPLPFCTPLNNNNASSSSSTSDMTQPSIWPADDPLPCTPVAAAGTQALVALFLWAASPLLVWRANPRAATVVPLIMGLCVGSVSYTHLTLPTILLV